MKNLRQASVATDRSQQVLAHLGAGSTSGLRRLWAWPRMDAPIAPIDVVDDEVEAWDTASVPILCALHGSDPELHNTGPHEFQRPRMQGEILPPREASGDFARLCSASDLAAYQCVQFCPGFCVQAIIICLDAEAVDGSNVQQNRSVSGRGFRPRLFSTGARLRGTSAIARAIDRLSAGGARGMLSARLFSTFCLGQLSVAILDSIVILDIT